MQNDASLKSMMIGLGQAARAAALTLSQAANVCQK